MKKFICYECDGRGYDPNTKCKCSQCNGKGIIEEKTEDKTVPDKKEDKK